MKKLVTACALCAAMSAFAVDSQNIVGYTTKTTTANTLDMMGIAFQSPGTNAISIQSVVPQTGFSLEGGDAMRIWNPLTQGYTTFLYFSSTFADGNYDPDLGAGWADVNQIRATVTLTPGQGFWLKTQTNATFTVSGEVVKPTSNQISTLANTLDMVAGVFPATMSIQAAVPVSGFSLEGGDALRIWNPSTQGYTTFLYFSSTFADGNYDPDLGAGWADVNQIRSVVTIAQGQGFWLKTQTNAVLSFTAPY